MYPQLHINLKKLQHNAEFLLKLCEKSHISAAAVTKVFCADEKMVEVLCGLPFAFLADSRLENLESYKKMDAFKRFSGRTMLLRLPSPSEARRTVEACDVSLNSELFTLKALAKAAEAAGIRHGVVQMIDLGDLREGVFYKNKKLLFETVDFILSQKNLTFEGIGVNLTCYGSVLPTTENLQLLCEIASDITKHTGKGVGLLSGGNSSSLYLLEKGLIPGGVNNLRLGESIVRGVETAYGKPFAGLEQDVVTLEAEIIEIMEKPSMPEGEIGINAFGEKIRYKDYGIRKRAILAIGRQDTSEDGLTCLCPGTSVTGSSSDHLIIDITDADEQFSVGDTLKFSLSYGAILAGFTSKYVKREYI